MRNTALVAFGLLAACAATHPPARGDTQARNCRLSDLGHFIGQTATDAVGAAILRETHSRVIRWAPPGVMLTMDYRADRVTVRLGPGRQITAINCG